MKKTAKAKSPRKRSPAPKKAAPAKMASRRADFGAPIDGFFAKQPPPLRAILEALRKLIDEAAPEAKASIKWGMPFYELDGVMLCALGAHKAHVNLILSGPPGTYADPEGRLEGEGKLGKHLKLRSAEEIPTAAVRGWLKASVRAARGGK